MPIQYLGMGTYYCSILARVGDLDNLMDLKLARYSLTTPQAFGRRLPV
jgi:hypothetical protein